MTDPTTATERLRRIAVWECVVTSRDGDMIDCDAHPIDGSKDVEFWTITVPGNKWQEGHAFYVVAEHAADDAELITEEWVRSIAPRYWEAGKESYWPEYGLRFSEKIGDNPGGFYFWNEGPSSHLQKVTYIKGITTRGQLQLLLRALSQEPQP